MGDPGLIPSTPIWRFIAVCNSSSSTLFQLPCHLHMCEKYTHTHTFKRKSAKQGREGLRNEKGTTHQPLASVCVCMHTHNHSQAHVQTHKNMHTVCSGLNTADQTPAAAHNSGWAGLGLCLSLHTCLHSGPLGTAVASLLLA